MCDSDKRRHRQEKQREIDEKAEDDHAAISSLEVVGDDRLRDHRNAIDSPRPESECCHCISDLPQISTVRDTADHHRVRHDATDRVDNDANSRPASSNTGRDRTRWRKQPERLWLFGARDE